MKKRIVFIYLLILIGYVNLLAQSTYKYNMNGIWKLTWTDRILCYPCFKTFDYETDTSAYTDVPVPLDLNLYMQQVKLADDPNIGLNALTNRWIGEQYYQYYTAFEVSEELVNENTNARLIFEHLDLIADIYLNGEHIGDHQNCYIPCIIDVTGKLRKEKNKLIVAIESGYYYTSVLESKSYFSPLARQMKWPYLRKPAYQYYWDWNTRLVNVGITGDVYLEFFEKAKIEQVVPTVRLTEDLDTATIETRLLIENVNQEAEAFVSVLVEETGSVVSKKVQLQKGKNDLKLFTKIADPELWWPVGHGDQKLYNLKIICEIDNKIADSYEQRIGIRKIEIHRPKHELEGEYFMLHVNNRPIFCKGGNWVPPGLIYSAIDSTKIAGLIDMAIESHFNFFRVNGVGTYPSHYFFNLCDEKGILVWQEFMFAGSNYPIENPNFLGYVKEEITFIVRDYAYHPSLAVWCGNNEIELHHANKLRKGKSPYYPDYSLFHFEIPRIINNEDPSRPYRPSSPYSSVVESPNSPIYGDQHPWGVTLDNGPDFWEYRKYTDRFAIEGGVMGTSTLKTMSQFLPAGQEYIHSKSWDYHDNTFNLKNLLMQARASNFLNFWLGYTVNDLSFEDYIFASSILQAEGLDEYVRNYRRRMFNSAAAVFWMYSDSWPVTHGWTIVDYFQRKKSAYFSVKRAFQPITVVVAEDSSGVFVYGVNDSPEAWKGNLQYGIFSLADTETSDLTSKVVIPANQSVILAEIDNKEWQKSDKKKHGAFAVLYENDTPIAQHRLFTERFKDLEFEEPNISIQREDKYAVFTSERFAWGVHIDVNGECDIEDNCFDIIPGVKYYVEWPNEKELPNVLITGNDLILD